jgi:hypothetical protein
MLIGIRLSVMHEPNTDIVANVIKDVWKRLGKWRTPGQARP